MPYTLSSIALAWIVTVALLGLTASGATSGRWLILAVLAALATPALLRRSPVARVIPVGRSATPGGRRPA